MKYWKYFNYFFNCFCVAFTALAIAFFLSNKDETGAYLLKIDIMLIIWALTGGLLLFLLGLRNSRKLS